ncbi:MAG: Ig-like domain-containing protein [archaeon]
MNHKKILITLALLFLLIGTGIALGAPEIISPDDGTIKNQTEFILNWTSVENAFCYRIYESGSKKADVDAPDTNYIVNTNEGTFTYEVRSSSRDGCTLMDGNFSDPVTVTVDTTPPSISSKSPVGDRVDVDLDEIRIEFDGGESGINQTYTESNFNVPGADGSISWDGDETLVYSLDETLDYSTEYEVEVEAKDKAGNTADLGWTFETDTPAEKIDIEKPEEGEEYPVDTEMDLRAKVTDEEGNPVKGGYVDTSGVTGCSETLENPDSDGRFTGKCNPSKTGTQTIEFTAEAAGKTVTDSKTIEVIEEPPIEIEIIEPDFDENHTRGDTIQFKIETRVEGEPHEDVSEVRSDTLGDFDQGEEPHIWEKTYETEYDEPLEQHITIEAKGTVITRRTYTRTRTLNLKPIKIDIKANFFKGGEELTERLEGGEEIQIRANTEYPDGTPVEDLESQEEIKGKLFIIDDRGEEGEEELTLTHAENGEYRPEERYTVRSRDSEIRAVIDVEDPYKNTGETEKTIEGPAGALEFTLTQPTPKTGSPGQNLTIKGYVESQDTEEKFTEPEVTVNGEEMEVTADDHYEKNYKIPTNMSVGDDYNLNFEIEYGEIIYSNEITLEMQAPKIKLDEERLEERGVSRNDRITAEIIYPNGDPVTEGEYYIEIEEQEYTLTYNPETEIWETEEIDLGREEQLITLTAAGKTMEEIESEETGKTNIEYKWDPDTTEWLMSTPLAIAGIITTIITILIAVWYYFKRYRYIKEFNGKINELKETYIRMDNAFRAYAKTHDSERLSSRQGDLKGQQRSLREEIEEIIEKHPFLKKRQRKEARKMAEKAVKRKLSHYGKGIPGKRAWLTGLSNYQARKIETEIKDRYAEEIKEMKEKGMEEEEIKEKFIEKYEFRKNRADDIIKYQKGIQKHMNKIKSELKEGKKSFEIKEEIKEDLKTGNEEFKEYRARQLIKKAGGVIEVKEPEEKKLSKKEKEKHDEEMLKTREKEEEHQKIEFPEEKEPDRIEVIKELIGVLEKKGMEKEQIEREIEREGKKIGIKPETIENIMEEINHE